MGMLYLSPPLCLQCMIQNELYLLVVIVSLDYSDFRRNFKVGIQKIIFTFGNICDVLIVTGNNACNSRSSIFTRMRIVFVNF